MRCNLESRHRSGVESALSATRRELSTYFGVPLRILVEQISKIGLNALACRLSAGICLRSVSRTVPYTVSILGKMIITHKRCPPRPVT